MSTRYLVYAERRDCEWRRGACTRSDGVVQAPGQAHSAGSLHAVRRRRSSTWSSSFGMVFEVPPRIVGACATSPHLHSLLALLAQLHSSPNSRHCWVVCSSDLCHVACSSPPPPYKYSRSIHRLAMLGQWERPWWCWICGLARRIGVVNTLPGRPISRFRFHDECSERKIEEPNLR